MLTLFNRSGAHSWVVGNDLYMFGGLGYASSTGTIAYLFSFLFRSSKPLTAK